MIVGEPIIVLLTRDHMGPLASSCCSLIQVQWPSTTCLRPDFGRPWPYHGNRTVAFGEWNKGAPTDANIQPSEICGWRNLDDVCVEPVIDRRRPQAACAAELARGFTAYLPRPLNAVHSGGDVFPGYHFQATASPLSFSGPSGFCVGRSVR